MVLLHCPNCQSRNISEFVSKNEFNPRPADPMQTGDAEWTDYLFLQENISGVQIEWWYHRAGCGLWFLAERDTRTNKILRTYRYQPNGTLPDAN